LSSGHAGPMAANKRAIVSGPGFGETLEHLVDT
jgi:hypothetical protein